MLSENSKKIKDNLMKLGVNAEVKEIPESTRTSADAAKALGCSVSEIAKSILFKGEKTGKPIMVIASGSNRISEKKIESIVGEQIAKANAEFVKEKTGFSIGGVPPIGHKEKIEIFIDKGLLNYETVWAAAGTPNSVFSISPKKLAEITKGKIIEVI